MSTTLSDFHKEQYDIFRNNLTSIWAIDESKLTEWAPNLKPIHKKFLSFACAASIVGHRMKRNEYVVSAVEAGNLSIVLSLKGLQNPAFVLLRQSIELILKHIYFLQHPVEYSWAQSRIDYKELSFQFLLKYLKRTDEYMLLSNNQQFVIADRVEYSYHILSRYVHVHSKAFMGYKTLAKPIGIKMLKKLNENIKELWPILSLILIAFSKNKFIQSSMLEQRAIRNNFPKNMNDMLNSYLIATS